MSDARPELRRRLALRHHRVGWWALLLFLSLGIALETMHGLKLGLYLDPPHRIRRLLWTLAHAHGTLLALTHIGFAAGLTHFGRWSEKALRMTSFLLIDALALLPLGFFLGGAWHTEVDPGPGVLLVPVGAAFLLVGVFLTAWAASRADSPPGPPGV